MAPALPSPQLEPVFEPDPQLGYVAKLAIHGDDIYAVGGTYHRPVFLVSRNGGPFERYPTPRTSGLRAIVVADERVVVVGEYGTVASTRTLGARWRNLATDVQSCLYTIARDAKRRLWVTGDAGLVLRSKPGGWTPIPTRCKGRMLGIFLEPGSDEPWVMSTESELRRWDGKRFVDVRLPEQRPKGTLLRMIRLPTRTLVIVGKHGVALRSTDDGATWTISPTHVTATIQSVAATPFGIVAAGQAGALLVSYDDARTFTAVASNVTGHLWSVVYTSDGVLVGAEVEGGDWGMSPGRIYRIRATELARTMAAAHAGSDEVLAALARGVAEHAEGARLVLEDTLRERGLW